MITKFKNHPTIETLKVSHDGTQIYYQGKIKRIYAQKNDKNTRRYPVVSFGNKSYFVSRLVFACWIGELPRNRSITFLDGNHLNLDYKNLLPKKHAPNALLGTIKQVRGYQDLFVNANGTYIVQFGFIINPWIGATERGGNQRKMAHIKTGGKSKHVYVSHLVYLAFVGDIGTGYVIHKDGNVNNDSANNLQVLKLKQYRKYQRQFLDKIRKKHPRLGSKIPQKDVHSIKNRLLSGDTLRSIANDYNTTDMSIVRFKKNHFTKEQIDQINKMKGINTTHTPKNIIDEVVKELQEGKKQIDVANKYGISPTVLCRINRQYIKKLKPREKDPNPKRYNEKSEALIDNIVYDLREGMRQSNAARKYKVTASYISTLNRKYITKVKQGVKSPEPIKRGFGSYISDKLIEKVKNLHEFNIPVSAIAQTLEISEGTINKMIKNNFKKKGG